MFDATTFCPKCDALRDAERFCHECGTKTVAPRCQNRWCKNSLSSRCKFCTFCGNAVTGEVLRCLAAIKEAEDDRAKWLAEHPQAYSSQQHQLAMMLGMNGGSGISRA